MTDVQDRYRQVASGFDAAVKAARPDKWEAQTPCEQWRARDVVTHVVEGHRSVIAAVRGGQSNALGADEDASRAWEDASRAIDEITGDPGAVAKEIDGPVGKMPAGQVIGQFVTMDTLVHTWDLARAVGADEHLDEDTVRLAYEALKPMDAMIRQPNVFGPKLEPPPGADIQTEFLYFLGRRALAEERRGTAVVDGEGPGSGMSRVVEGVSVREMPLSEVGTRIRYFHEASDDYLLTLGVDRDLLPTPEEWRSFHERDYERPLTARQNYALLWELDGQAVGFSSLDHIVFGDEAFMHLHIVERSWRRRGLGATFVKLSASTYFETFELQHLYCEPNALNVAPNRTLQRAGFTYLFSHETIPGPINFRQVTTRWVLDRPPTAV